MIRPPTRSTLFPYTTLFRSSVQIGQSSTCTASVKDTSPGTPGTPTGTVDFTNDGSGSFTGTPCSLGAVNSTTANCSVSFAPSGTSARTETITGTYTPAQSDTRHQLGQHHSKCEQADNLHGCKLQSESSNNE